MGGKDASKEFDMIHPPGVVEKYAPNAVIGTVKGAGVEASASAPTTTVSVASKGSRRNKDWSKKSKNYEESMKSVGKMGGCCGALAYMVFAFREVVLTIFWQGSLTLAPAKNSRIALTRSAMFMFLFIVIHAVGNLHVFLGPDDFNGYGYFYVRLYFTGFGLPANIVEEYVLLAALLHVVVALKRTWDISINYTIASGKMNLAISGVALLTFMTIHLFQFRFGDTQNFKLCPPPLYINVKTILDLRLNLFWVPDAQGGCKDHPQDRVFVRDIYLMEFYIFKSFGWMFFYVSAVSIFATHMCLGWKKVVPAPGMEIPQRHHNKAIHIGYIMTAFIAIIYISFPLYAHLMDPSNGEIAAAYPISE